MVRTPLDTSPKCLRPAENPCPQPPTSFGKLLAAPERPRNDSHALHRRSVFAHFRARFRGVWQIQTHSAGPPAARHGTKTLAADRKPLPPVPDIIWDAPGRPGPPRRAFGCTSSMSHFGSVSLILGRDPEGYGPLHRQPTLAEADKRVAVAPEPLRPVHSTTRHFASPAGTRETPPKSHFRAVQFHIISPISKHDLEGIPPSPALSPPRQPAGRSRKALRPAQNPCRQSIPSVGRP